MWITREKTETPMNTTTPVPNNHHTKIITCMIFSMEEGVMRRVKSFENKNEGISLRGVSIWQLFHILISTSFAIRAVQRSQETGSCVSSRA